MIRGSEVHFSLGSRLCVCSPIALPTTQKQEKKRKKGGGEGRRCRKRKGQAKNNGDGFLLSLGRKACNAPRKQ